MNYSILQNHSLKYTLNIYEIQNAEKKPHFLLNNRTLRGILHTRILPYDTARVGEGGGGRNSLIRLNSLHIRSEIWRQSRICKHFSWKSFKCVKHYQ